MGRSVIAPLGFALLWALPAAAQAQAQAEPAAPAPIAAPAPAAVVGPVPEPAIPATPPTPQQPGAPAQAAEPQPEPEPESKPEPKPSPPAVEPAAAEPALAEAEVVASTPSSAALDDASKDAPPWLARITWDQTYNTAGFTRGDEPSFNPEYAWLFLFEAGYKPDALTRLYLRQDLALELTDSDTTTTSQELVLADTIAEVWRTFLDEQVGAQKILLAGRVGARLPLSKASQASHTIATSRLRLDARASWDGVLNGLDAGLSLRQYHRFATSNVAHAETPFPCDVLDTDVSPSCTQLPGSSTVRDIFAFVLDAEITLLPSFSFGAMAWFEWDLAHGLRDERFEHSGTSEVIEDGSATHWRNSRIIELWFGYEFSPWLSGRAHVTNTFAERSPDPQLRAPFNVLDTVLGLELTVRFEALYQQAAQHGGSG